MLIINNLTASLNEINIIKNFNLEIKKNEIHILIGPNGCGKSTLSKIIAGYPYYKINEGDLFYKKKDIKYLAPEIRAQNGIFLGFQHPIEISGINNFEFLHLIYNEKQKFLNKKLITPIKFFSILEPYLKDLNMKKNFLNRNLNEGFSGGEKKKNEILQMLLLSPELIILDELDSGVDIDALKDICFTILKYRKKNSSFLLITHSSRLFKYFDISLVHLMINGKIIKTGKKELLEHIENLGYSTFI